MGGFGVAAHPDRLKDQLRWNGWDAVADGIEVAERRYRVARRIAAVAAAIARDVSVAAGGNGRGAGEPSSAAAAVTVG